MRRAIESAQSEPRKRDYELALPFLTRPKTLGQTDPVAGTHESKAFA
jgi:hypothetical protein